MKIDNSIKSLTSGPASIDSERSAKKSATTAASPGETVRLSSTSAHLQAIEQGFADTPIVDTARVAEIKQAISNGHFRVDADKVADRLLSTVRELIMSHKA